MPKLVMVDEMVYANKRKKKGVYLLAKYELATTSQPIGIPTNKNRKREIVLFLDEAKVFSVGIRYKDYQKITPMMYQRTRGGIGAYPEDILVYAQKKLEDKAKWKWEFKAPFILDQDDKIYKEYWTGGSLKARFTLAKFESEYCFRYSGDFTQSSKYGGVHPMKVQVGTVMTELEFKIVQAKAKKISGIH